MLTKPRRKWDDTFMFAPWVPLYGLPTREPSWNPLMIPDLLAYGKAATVGNTTSQWNDETGNGHHLTQATADLRMAFRTVGGLTSYVPPSILPPLGDSDPPGWDVPAGLEIDRQDFTFFCVTRPRSYPPGGDVTYANLGPTLAECLIDNTGASPVYVRMFNNATTLVPYCNPHPLIVRGGAAGVKVWLGNQTPSTVAAFASGTSAGGLLFRRQDGYGIAGDQYEWGFIDGQISDEDAQAYIDYAAATYGPVAFTKQVVICGDSLTEGQNATLNRCWPMLMSEAQSNAYRVYSAAKSGTSLSAENSNVAGLAGLYDAGLTENVAILFLGTNDLGVLGDSAATVLGRIQTWCTAMKGAGFSVVVSTIMPRDDVGWDGTKESRRLSLNASIRALSNTYADAIVDPESDARLSDPTNGTYFDTDKLHLLDPAEPILAAMFGAAVAGL